MCKKMKVLILSLVVLLVVTEPSFATYGKLVWHSQNKLLPTAIKTPNFVKAYDGYSLLGLYDNYNRRNAKDLSEPSSCQLEANVHPTPFTICRRDNCDYGNPAHVSDWLTNDKLENKQATISTKYQYAIIKNRQGVVTSNDIATIKGLISTCSVYDTSALIVARHSYSNKVPECPGKNWEMLWEGYSFASSGWRGSDTKTDSPQDLGSSGSCLPEFVPQPVLSCWTGDGQNENYCQRARDVGRELTTWLAVLGTPRGNTLNDGVANNNKSKVSRCVVCAKY